MFESYSKAKKRKHNETSYTQNYNSNSQKYNNNPPPQQQQQPTVSNPNDMDIAISGILTELQTLKNNQEIIMQRLNNVYDYVAKMARAQLSDNDIEVDDQDQ